MKKQKAAADATSRRKARPVVDGILIAVPYLAVGSIWIFLSDSFLAAYQGNIKALLLFSNIKGWVFVFITAVLVFLLVRARVKQLRHYQDHLEAMIAERTSEYKLARQEALDLNAEKETALKRMNHLSEFEGIILHMAETFINAPIEEIDNAMNNSLERIGRYLGEDRIYLAEYDYSRRVSSIKQEWDKKQGSSFGPAWRETPFDSIKDMVEAHERGEIFNVPDTLEKGWNKDLKTMLEQESIKSFISIPILSRDKPIGFIGICALGAKKAWKEDDLSILKIFAETIRNVYERRMREITIQKTSRNMRTILDATLDTIFLIEKEGTIIDLNASAAAFLHKTIEEATGANIRDVMSAKIVEDRNHVIEETLASGMVGHYLGMREDRWIDSKFYPVFDPDGTVGAIAAFSEDITERVVISNEIYKSQQMLKEVIDNAPVGIFWRSADNKILGLNRIIPKIAGMSAEELINGDGDEMRPVDSDGDVDYNMQILSKGVPKLNYEASMVNALGETHILRMSKVPIMDKEGKPYVLLGVVEDVTEQKNTMQELMQAKQDASAASKAKSEFLSMMSHEIRSPLNSIIGLTQLVSRTDDCEKITEYLGKIDLSSKHLLGIINDILDISKIEAGKLTIRKAEFSFDELMEEAVGIVLPKANEKKQTLNLYLDREVPPRLIGDSLRMKQVLVNLLANAVKFTHGHGTITVRANSMESAGNRILLNFSVEDTGIGISADKIVRLFSPFEQVNKASSREHGGTGLGLAISKSIVQSMGGEIAVRSTPGEGSVFSFSVPLEVAQSCQHVQPNEFGDLHILVVDDNAENCRYLSAMLDRISVCADTALSMEEAYEKSELACREGRPYQVAFIDWHMPIINKIATAGKTKRKCCSKTQVVLISSFEREDAEDKLRESGISLTLPRPILSSKLRKVLRNITSNPDSDMPVAGVIGKDIFLGKRILVAEDMEINQMIIREILRDTGVQIVPAMDGRQAVSDFVESDSDFDAILMDVQMPNMDGCEASIAIRSSGRRNAGSVAILAMTANVFREDVEAAMLAGMDDHISKPIDYDVLIEKLGRYLL